MRATVVREAVHRSGVDLDDFGHAVSGSVIHIEPRDMYLSRIAAVNGGLPVTVPASTVLDDPFEQPMRRLVAYSHAAVEPKGEGHPVARTVFRPGR